jgi:tetratricopeptide (TPR) repeat protein
MRSTPR